MGVSSSGSKEGVGLNVTVAEMVGTSVSGDVSSGVLGTKTAFSGGLMK